MFLSLSSTGSGELKGARERGLIDYSCVAGNPSTTAAQTQRDWANHQPVRYPDPDVVAVDKSFERYQIFDAAIYRHYVGTNWADGPAWCAQGQYLVWSYIPNDRQ